MILNRTLEQSRLDNWKAGSVTSGSTTSFSTSASSRRGSGRSCRGADLTLELVGAPTLRDTLRTLSPRSIACFTGMLSNAWVVDDFYPIDYLPNAIGLTAYSGEGTDLPSAVLQDYLAAAALDPRLIPAGPGVHSR